MDKKKLRELAGILCEGVNGKGVAGEVYFEPTVQIISQGGQTNSHDVDILIVLPFHEVAFELCYSGEDQGLWIHHYHGDRDGMITLSYTGNAKQSLSTLAESLKKYW